MSRGENIIFIIIIIIIIIINIIISFEIYDPRSVKRYQSTASFRPVQDSKRLQKFLLISISNARISCVNMFITCSSTSITITVVELFAVRIKKISTYLR